MAKKIFNKRILALVLALTMCFSLVNITASAAKWNGNNNYNPGNNTKPGNTTESDKVSSDSEYEWYQVYINDILEEEDQGEAGDDGWLVRGVYSWEVTVSGTTLYWRAGAHDGTVELDKYIVIPEGFEAREDGCTIEHSDVSGDNSQSDRFDYAVITVTINVLYDKVTNETIPAETIPETTEAPTVPETEPVTEAPTVPETEPVTEAPTVPETEPVTEAPTIPETEPVTEAPTVPETEPVTEAPTVPETEPVTEAPTVPETEPVTEAPTVPETEPVTEAPTVPETEPVTEAPTEPEKYDVIHEYYTDGDLDGKVPGGEIVPGGDVEKQLQHEGNDYIHINTIVDEESKTIIVVYNREILIVEIPEEDVPLVDIPEENVPLVEIPEEDVPLVEIPDEDVPLADVPKTGDPMAIYMALSVLSGIGLAALGFKKKEN